MHCPDFGTAFAHEKPVEKYDDPHSVESLHQSVAIAEHIKRHLLLDESHQAVDGFAKDLDVAVQTDRR